MVGASRQLPGIGSTFSSLVLLSLLLARCGYSCEYSDARHFLIAYVGSQFYPSGKIADWGVSAENSLELGLEDVRLQGLCGPGCTMELPSHLIFQANGTDTTELKSFVKLAVDAGVVAIVGADWTRVAVSVLSELRRLDSSVPLISVASAASLGNSTMFPNFLRTAYSDALAIQVLIQDLVARAEASGGKTLPGQIIVLYSLEDFGEAGLHIVEQAELNGGPAVVSKRGFQSGSSISDIRLAIRELFGEADMARPAIPIFFISATGPDTTSSMLALKAEGVLGPPAGSWIVGAIEASSSVVHSAEEVKAAAGYNSYLGSAPIPGTCSIIDDFTSRFQTKFGHFPAGGWEAYTYDAVLLVATSLRIASQTTCSSASPPSLLRILRSPSFGVQGLTGRLVFRKGENQPCRPALEIKQLLLASLSDYTEAKVATNVLIASDLCPSLPLASNISAISAGYCTRGASTLHYLCDPIAQNSNACRPSNGILVV